ncbi:MAG: TIM barrel protein [Planctomycetaceae bacterium]
MPRLIFTLSFLLAALISLSSSVARPAVSAESELNLSLFEHDNLVAWCIVPFDSSKRGPEERAAMLEELGIKRLAYDYRAEHIPTFDQEIESLKARGIELTAWWFPGALNDEAKMTLEIFKKHDLHPQLWITGHGEPTKSAEEQRERVKAEATRVKSIATAAAEVGCKVGLYNHGGWFGEPENQIEIIKEVNLNNVGIVYNLHHGHNHLDRFATMLEEMKPYLITLNLNGMMPGHPDDHLKIVPLGAGEVDLKLLKIIASSGWEGPVGILDHDTTVDSKLRLQDNLNGLDWLVNQLRGDEVGERPDYKSWKMPASAATLNPSKVKGVVLDGDTAYRTLPLTLLCETELKPSAGYNILVANDGKNSGTHWELFTHPNSGAVSAYLPGMSPDHVHSQFNICDSQLHTVSMQLEENRVRLYVDGQLKADQAVKSLQKRSVPAGLAIGTLVEHSMPLSGDVNRVRILRGIVEIQSDKQLEKLPQESSLFEWTREEGVIKASRTSSAPGGPTLEYDPQLVQDYVAEATSAGNAEAGLAVFTSAKSACISCHKLGENAGRSVRRCRKLGLSENQNRLWNRFCGPNGKSKKNTFRIR